MFDLSLAASLPIVAALLLSTLPAPDIVVARALLVELPVVVAPFPAGIAAVVVEFDIGEEI